MNLPVNYVIDKIYKYAFQPKHKSNNSYNFGCPVCREGDSKYRKKRGYFFVREEYFFCHNCQHSWSPISWIQTVSGLTAPEIYEEASSYTHSLDEVLNKHQPTTEEPLVSNKRAFVLPFDSINLTDPIQTQFYAENKVVRDCLRYINDRLLFRAINRPRTYYVSLYDKLHKNRLCIPFHDENGKIIFYQTRAVYKEDEEPAKYLSKVGATKSVFGIDRIVSSLDYIFIFEGPIDSTFVRNGVAMGGLSMNDVQKKQMGNYRLFTKIWVLDNQLENKAVFKKYEELIEAGERIVIWSPEFKAYKDLNEWCVATKNISIDPKVLIDNSYVNLQAHIKLSLAV